VGACPIHGELPGLGTYCERCGEYVDRIGVDEPRARRTAGALVDTRDENQRKADARQVVEAMGWLVLDFEQGYRPDDCPACGAHLPGGHSTRVPRGIGDWLCMRSGMARWVEWKTDTNGPTPHQRAFGEECAKKGIRWAVCRNTEEVVLFLQ